MLSIALGAFSVMLVPVAHREARLLKSAWVAAGFVVGLYAVVEVTLQRSPLLAAVYEAIGFTPDRFFALGLPTFRADAGFGHPLWAGAYLTAAAVLGIVGWMQGGHRRDLVFGVGAAAGAVATLSRGAISAIAIGVAAGIILVALIGARRPWWRIVGIGGWRGFRGGDCAVVRATHHRIESAGAESSSGIRVTSAEIALADGGSHRGLGTGAGTSGVTGQIVSATSPSSRLLRSCSSASGSRGSCCSS